MDMTRVATGIWGSREFFLLAGIFTCLLLTTLVLSAQAQGVDLPQTGQTKCYNASGDEIACAGTGQDGEIRAGVAWPEPRFTDNGDGTLTDNLTGLIWLKNANCYDRVTWAAALSNAASLADGVCGLSDSSQFGDWRLPNVLELESLVHFDYHAQFADPNIFSSNALWLNSQGFTTAQSSGYWSSTTAPNHADSAYYVYMDAGYTHFDGKGETAYFVAVRGVSDGPAPVWKTGQTIVRQAGDDGDLQTGTPWPSPRFIDHNDGTVTDQLTGLTWLKNANCAGSPRGWDAALNDVAHLNATGTMNAQGCGDTSNGGSHQTDWRLPNIKELRSLNDFSAYNPTVAAGHPFTNLLTNQYHLSSSQSSRGTADAWVVAMVDGYTNLMPKDPGFGTYYVWPVRGGVVSTVDSHTFAGGDGSEGNPFQVATAAQLALLKSYRGAAHADKHFIQVADIDLGVAPWNEGAGWEPIGGYLDEVSFRGNYDGNGYVIKNLTITTSDSETYASLFGRVGYLGTIRNLRLENIDITATGHAGGIAGYLESGRLSSCRVSGQITLANGMQWYAGGFVGYLSGEIENSHASVSIHSSSGERLGGMVGATAHSTILNSYATGNVSGVRAVGGLVGEVWNNVSIEHSYATGAVTGNSEVGGLVGVPGFDLFTVVNSYYNRDTSGQSDTGKGEPRTTDELKQQATFTDWDFTDTWKLIENATAPYLRWQKYFVFDGVQVQLIENERDIKAGHVVTPGSDVPATRVQSTVADQSAADIEGLHGRWMAVTRAGSTEMRAVAATDGDGESRTWFEVYNAQTEAWEKGSTTLALDSDAFEAGNEIVIEEDDADGLQIRIETQVTRELHF